MLSLIQFRGTDGGIVSILSTVDISNIPAKSSCLLSTVTHESNLNILSLVNGRIISGNL